MYTLKINQDEINPGLERLSRALTDMSPVMNQIGEIIEEDTAQRWERGEAPDGVPWAPKSQATLEAYRRRGVRADPRPLYGPNESGVPLRQSIFRTYGPDHVQIGTNAIQAAVMHFGAAKGEFGQTSRGAPIPWGDIPARPILGMSDGAQTNVIDELADWLRDVSGF